MISSNVAMQSLRIDMTNAWMTWKKKFIQEISSDEINTPFFPEIASTKWVIIWCFFHLCSHAYHTQQSNFILKNNDLNTNVNMTATQTKTKSAVPKYWKNHKQISLPEKGTIVSIKRYYRFHKKVLSFHWKSTIVFIGAELPVESFLLIYLPIPN